MSYVYEHWDNYGHRLQVNTLDEGEVWFEIAESEQSDIFCAGVPKSMIPELIRFLETA